MQRGADDAELDPPEARRGCKRKLSEVQVTRQSQALRHRAWLGRYAGGPSATSWRPNPVFRVAAKHWLDCVDNSFRVTCGKGGLRYFEPRDPTWLKGWRDHPFGVIAMDQGSDGMTGLHYAQYKLGLCLEGFMDPSHGIHNDVDRAVADVELRPLMLLMVVSMNLPFGPYKEDWRFHQIRDHMKHNFAKNTARTQPLFQALANHIIAAYEALGHFFSEDSEKDVQAWNLLKDRAWFSKQGRRITLCRFLAFISGLKHHLPEWALHLWERTYVALEEDYFKNKSLQRLIIKPTRSEAMQDGTVPTGESIGWDDKQFRSCCQNSVVVSAMVLSDWSNLRYCRIILAAAQRAQEWHSSTNKALRCSDDIEKWIVAQCTGAFMEHVTSIVFACESPALLQEAQFMVSASTCRHCDDGEVICEDEFADTFGQICSSLAAHRLRRMLWLVWGWPWSMSAVLEESYADETMKRFDTDLHVWTALQSSKNQVKEVQRLIQRHPFQKSSCRQLISAWVDRDTPNFAVDLRALQRSHCRVACPTQLVEDMIGTAKNAKVVKMAQKFRRPELAMASILQHKVITQKHRWHTVNAETPIGPKSVRLDDSCFKAKVAHRSMDWQKVCSHERAPGFYSPKAENYSTNHADLPLLKACVEAGDVNLAADAWMADLFSVGHRVVFRLPSELPKYAGVWYHALHHFDKSSVLAWPGSLVQMAGLAEYFFERARGVSAPVLIPVWNLTGIVAATFKWRSFAWQWRRFQGSGSELTARVLPFLDVGPVAVAELAVRCAFWKLSRAFVVRFSAQVWGLNIPAKASLCVALQTVVQHVFPGIAPGELLAILQLRMAVNDTLASFATAILEVDEAQVAMDRQDIEKLTEEQKSAEDMQVERQEFVFEYAKVRNSLDPPKRKAESTAPKSLPALEQKNIKQFLPPGASVWRSNTRDEWCGHMPPHKRIQASFIAFGGEEGAALDVLRRLWQQWAHLGGKSQSDIPWDFTAASGLLSSGGMTGVVGASGADSSSAAR